VIRQSDLGFESDWNSFDRWIIANFVLGSFVAGGIVLMAIAASNVSFAPSGALAGTTKTAYSDKSFRHTPPSAYDLMARLAPDQLSLQPPDEQAF
jgi:hypothetical protein